MSGLGEDDSSVEDCDVTIEDMDFDTLRARHVGSAALLYRSAEMKQKEPYKQERPWHRHAAYLLASGMTNKQVGEALGRNVASVSHLRAQPFFRELCAKVITEFNLADDSAFNVLRSATGAAALKIVELSANAQSETVRLAASKEVLDRSFGTVTRMQAQIGASVPLNPMQEAEELRRNVERLKQNLSGRILTS